MSKKYPVLRSVYLFRGIYANDVPDTELSGRCGREKTGQLTFEVKGNLPVLT